MFILAGCTVWISWIFVSYEAFCCKVQYDNLDTCFSWNVSMKYCDWWRCDICFLFRRESPWKVDGESTGVSSKLKLLEQELSNLEKIGKSDLSRVPSLMRKQAKRYQAFTAKIDDLCRRMVRHICLRCLFCSALSSTSYFDTFSSRSYFLLNFGHIKNYTDTASTF